MPDTHILALLPAFRCGPAQVTAVIGREMEVAIEERRLIARSAVPALYQPTIGDTVLVVEADAAAYVIGVLQASGPMVVAVPNDLLLSAPNGRIALDAATIGLDAGRLSIRADELGECFGSVRRIVRGLLEIDAGEICTRVQELFSLTVRRLRAKASQDVRIDGARIHLG